jgi:hypothetical protein
MPDSSTSRSQQLSADQIQMLRHGLLASEWCGFIKIPMVHALCDMALASLTRSETERSGWVPVTDGLPADQPGGWLVFNTDTGKLWFETNLPSWWNRKDERGREFDGPAVTHWREDFYPLPGPRK